VVTILVVVMYRCNTLRVCILWVLVLMLMLVVVVVVLLVLVVLVLVLVLVVLVLLLLLLPKLLMRACITSSGSSRAFPPLLRKRISNSCSSNDNVGGQNSVGA
jgi:hypothetical protein